MDYTEPGLIFWDKSDHTLMVSYGPKIKDYNGPGFLKLIPEKWGVSLGEKTDLWASDPQQFTLIGKIPSSELPEHIKIKKTNLPDKIQRKIESGDFGCRKESVTALIEELWAELKK